MKHCAVWEVYVRGQAGYYLVAAVSALEAEGKVANGKIVERVAPHRPRAFTVNANEQETAVRLLHKPPAGSP